MHDPMTLAFEIRYPWRAYRHPRSDFERKYRESFITIWHVDPETDGTDDSCGWFPRARHGDKAVLDRIAKSFESDWDRTWTSEDTGNTYYCGFFAPDVGAPVMSVSAIALNLFFVASLEVFKGRKRAVRFMQENLFEILLFSENTFDSMRDTITLRFENDTRKAERIRGMASMIYGWILREQRPWYRHPRWHFWHWRFQVHPWQNLRRFLLTRCCKCGGMFRYGESPVTSQWESPKPRFLRGETGLYHSNCSGEPVKETKAA